jgi:hypothetical protein
LPIHTEKVDSLYWKKLTTITETVDSPSSPASATFSSAGADSAKEYNAKDCIKKFRIIFQPEYSRDEFGHRTTHLLRGAKAQELLP